MEEQLVAKYFSEFECRHGVYLVGWYYCNKWRWQKGTLRPLSIDEARDYFLKQASQLSLGDAKVEASVLDARYPD